MSERIDKGSPTWRIVEAYVRDRIAATQPALEDPNNDLADTNFHRGMVAAYRAVLTIPDSQEVADNKIDTQTAGLPFGMPESAPDF